MSHQSLLVTPSLTMHALMRPSMSDPCFSIREIDMKMLRHGGIKKKAPVSSNSATLNEQAARVKARQLMLSYATQLIEATKDEIRWLKDCGVLGKRAPKSSLMSATYLLSLLREQQKTSLAAHLQNALVTSRIGKWKAQAKIVISEEEAAAEAAAAAAAQHAAEVAAEAAANDAASAAAMVPHASGGAFDADLHGDGGQPIIGAPSRPRRRPSASHKRKNDDGVKVKREDGVGEDDTSMQRRKRSRRSTAHAGNSALSSTAAAASSFSAGIVPMSSDSPTTATRPTLNMSVSKAVLLLNPRDRGARMLASGVHFGADHTSLMTVVQSDRCTIVGPHRGSASARATHGITSGSWYIEVKGSEVAAQAMRDTVSRSTAAAAASAAAASIVDQDAPPHCRIGFATASCPLDPKLLGHDDLSYAYGDRYGDKIHEGEASEYGSPFAIFQMDAHEELQSVPLRPGDVIGMLIELGVAQRTAPSESPTPSGASSPTSLNTGNRISFYKNGESQGIAWTDLPAGHAWYPAVSLINGMAVTFNFQVNMAQATPAVPTTMLSAAASKSHVQEATNSTFELRPIRPMHRMTYGQTGDLSHAGAAHDGQQQLYRPTTSRPYPAEYGNAATAATQLYSTDQSSPASSTSLVSSPAHHQRQMEYERKQLQHSHLHLAEPVPWDMQHTPAHHQQPAPHHSHHSQQAPEMGTLSKSERLARLQQQQQMVHQQLLVQQQQQQQQHQQQQPHQPQAHQQSHSSHAHSAAPHASHSLPHAHPHPPHVPLFSDSSPRATAIFQSTHTLALAEDSSQSHMRLHSRRASTSSATSAQVGGGSPSSHFSTRHLRVPTADEEATNGVAMQVSAIMQPSPSPSPSSFSLISPAPSPTPLVSSATASAAPYSLSTTPLPMLEEAHSSHLIQFGHQLNGSPMPSPADIM